MVSHVWDIVWASRVNCHLLTRGSSSLCHWLPFLSCSLKTAYFRGEVRFYVMAAAATARYGNTRSCGQVAGSEKQL